MINYLKRRFSSGDIQGELKDERENLEQKSNAPMKPLSKENSSLANEFSGEEKSGSREARPMNAPLGAAPMKKQPSPSAPSSPTKTISLSAMMSAAKEILNNNAGNWANQPIPSSVPTSQNNRAAPYKTPNSQKEKYKVLLIIDYKNIDWIRFFRNRKINEFELRVEQVSFKKLTI